MENLQWIFDGIGTELISLIIGLLIGGGAGYKIGVKKTKNQTQKAGHHSTQTQIGSVKINDK